MARKGLGKGLDALIPNVVVKETAEENTKAAKEQAKTGVNDGRTIVNITKVEPNRKQPGSFLNHYNPLILKQDLDLRIVELIKRTSEIDFNLITRIQGCIKLRNGRTFNGNMLVFKH